jgi:hypothetical protein
MASTKSHLDKELDSYMNQAQDETWDWRQALCLRSVILLNCVCVMSVLIKKFVFNADSLQKCLWVFVSKHVLVLFTCQWTKIQSGISARYSTMWSPSV